MASLGSLISGAVVPLAGFNLSNCINAFSSNDKDKIRRRSSFNYTIYERKSYIENNNFSENNDGI